jgi:hypothetical protein
MAAAYWDGLTRDQEEWILRRMGIHRTGLAPRPLPPARRKDTIGVRSHGAL